MSKAMKIKKHSEELFSLIRLICEQSNTLKCLDKDTHMTELYRAENRFRKRLIDLMEYASIAGEWLKWRRSRIETKVAAPIRNAQKAWNELFSACSKASPQDLVVPGMIEGSVHLAETFFGKTKSCLTVLSDICIVYRTDVDYRMCVLSSALDTPKLYISPIDHVDQKLVQKVRRGDGMLTELPTIFGNQAGRLFRCGIGDFDV